MSIIESVLSMYIRNCNSFCRNYLLHRKIFSNSLLLTTELILKRIIPLLLSPCSKIFILNEELLLQQLQNSRKLNVKKMLHLWSGRVVPVGRQFHFKRSPKNFAFFFLVQKLGQIHGYYILTKLCHNWTSKNKKNYLWRKFCKY